MTLKENIKAILECNFAIAKEEVIEAATRRIMELHYEDIMSIPTVNVNNLIVEELEKVWEKIRALPDINPDYPMDKTIHISRYEVQKIIYERIAELKGKQE